MQPLVPRLAAHLIVFDKLPQRRRIIILGSTGSIGKSAIDVIDRFPNRFEVVGLAAFGSNPEYFAAQLNKFAPRRAVLLNPEAVAKAQKLTKVPIECGQEALLSMVRERDVDIVLAGIVGVVGLAPVLASLESGQIVALANKESLVVGGDLVRAIAAQKGPILLPVDSEHSALFQALLGSSDNEISSLTLTASGGPFLKTAREDLSKVTPAQAINHPRWKMGPKISVDSATLMNKALELIEAHYLYGIPANKLSAVIHPQSIVHAVVNFVDGASLLQASHPDMREPIAFALNYPAPRLDNIVPALDLATIGSLAFETIDPQRFPAIKIALECIAAGGSSCAVLNIANEYAVEHFLSGRLKFTDIVPFVEEVLQKVPSRPLYELEAIEGLQRETSEHSDFVIKRIGLS